MRSLKFLLLTLTLVFVLSFPALSQTKSITVSWPQEPDTLNPLYTTMTFAGYTIQLYLAPAWDFDADSNPHPVLVSEIPSTQNGGISPDGHVFTFRLKEALTWSDGDSLDANDFLFTHDMIVNEANTPLGRSPYDEIVSISAPDPLTVVVDFGKPYAAWFGLFRYVLPQHVLQPVFDSEGTIDNAAFNRAPSVSSGPYLFQEWDSGNFMRFVANPSFVGGTPIIETLVVTFAPDDTTYVANLVAGQTDLGTFVPFDQVPELEAAGLSVQIIASGYNEGIFLNTSPELGHPALQDVRVRQAIALGFDRFSLTENLLLGATYPPSSWWENTPYENPDLEAYPFDPAAAATLLDEAGWVDSNGNGIRDKDGTELSLRFVTNTRGIRRDVQAIVQQELGNIGIEVLLENYPSDVFFNGYANGGPVATGQYDIAQWSSSPAAFPDPNTTRFNCDEIPSDDNPEGGNWTFYCDPAIDELFDAQLLATDFNDRVAIFHEIDQMVYDSYTWIGVWHDADVWVLGARVQNAQINATSPFWDVVNWDMSN